MGEVSKHFREAFGDRSGSCVRMCDRCNVTSFDVFNNDWSWEPGEFEDLERLADEKPGEYKRCDGSVGGYAVFGYHLTDNCECGPHFEKIILRHRQQLSQYLGAVLAKKKAEVD